MAAEPSTFAELSQLKYKDQCVWFLNGMWDDFASEKSEIIYKYWEKFVELDRQQTPPKGADGNELDQFWSARYIEEVEVDEDGHKAAMTALERKEALKTIDVDSNGKMSAIEYLIWKYKKTPEQCLKFPQGSGDKDSLAAAQAKLDEVLTALDDVRTKQQVNNDAISSATAAKEDMEREEEKYNKAVNKCEAIVGDEAVSAMRRARAKNELAQLKAEDPLPLSRAKITNKAAIKRCEKAAKNLDKAASELEKKMEEAQEQLEQAKKGGEPAQGILWWMEREMFEADKSLPRSKQRYDHSKGFVYTP